MDGPLEGMSRLSQHQRPSPTSSRPPDGPGHPCSRQATWTAAGPSDSRSLPGRKMSRMLETGTSALTSLSRSSSSDTRSVSAVTLEPRCGLFWTHSHRKGLWTASTSMVQMEWRLVPQSWQMPAALSKAAVWNTGPRSAAKSMAA